MRPPCTQESGSTKEALAGALAWDNGGGGGQLLIRAGEMAAVSPIVCVVEGGQPGSRPPPSAPCCCPWGLSGSSALFLHGKGFLAASPFSPALSFPLSLPPASKVENLEN